VTGASRGIGRAIAIELGRAGACVAVGYAEHPAAAERVVSELEWAGGQGFAVHIRVEDRADVRAAVACVAERLGHIDFLVNNAGINRDRTMAKMTPEQWDEVIGVDLTGVFNVTHEVAPYMIRANYGRIVNVASVTGLAGTFGQANYVSAKAGIIGFTKTVARELARNKITVNLHCGWLHRNGHGGRHAGRGAPEDPGKHPARPLRPPRRDGRVGRMLDHPR